MWCRAHGQTEALFTINDNFSFTLRDMEGEMDPRTGIYYRLYRFVQEFGTMNLIGTWPIIS
jgi:hypothetical protein